MQFLYQLIKNYFSPELRHEKLDLLTFRSSKNTIENYLIKGMNTYLQVTFAYKMECPNHNIPFKNFEQDRMTIF